MKTAWLKKYPKLPGAARFQPYFVMVEVLASEDREEGFCTTQREFGEQYPGGYRDVWAKGTRTVSYTQVREKGKKAKWVQTSEVFNGIHRPTNATV